MHYMVSREFCSTIEVKKSKFLSYLMPFALYQSRLKELKLKHPKARHFIVAYRIVNEFNQIVEYSTDDKEPRNTAGKPTLKVLSGNNIVQSAIITVRYFGGIKLGTGGLTKAYSNSANSVIGLSNLIPYKKEITKKITVSYSKLSHIEYLLNKSHILIINKSFLQDSVELEIKAEQNLIEEFYEQHLKR